jgi:hypothetical protein
MPCNRNVVVNCIERHYDLLVRMAYLDPDVILRPPPEGWSDEELAAHTLQKWEQSDRVIDLLWHLPSLNKNMFDGKYEVYIETEASIHLRGYGWLEDKFKDDAQSFMMPFEEESPTGMIPLGQSHGGSIGTAWMIDTDEGMSGIQRAPSDIDGFTRDDLVYGTIDCEPRCAGT